MVLSLGFGFGSNFSVVLVLGGEVFGVKIFFVGPVGPWIAQENFQMVSIGSILQRSWVKKVQVSTTHQVPPTFLMLWVMTSAWFI